MGRGHGVERTQGEISRVWNCVLTGGETERRRRQPGIGAARWRRAGEHGRKKAALGRIGVSRDSEEMAGLSNKTPGTLKKV
jgi:hypothetical protein